MTGHPSAEAPRVAFLVESMEPRRGGAERAVLDVALELRERGVDVAVFAPADRCLEPATSAVPLHPVALPSGGRARRARALATRLPEQARAAGFERLVGCGKVGDCDIHWPHGGVHEAALRASCGAGRSAARAALALGARRLRPVERVFKDLEERCYARVRAGESRVVAISERVRRDMVRHHDLTPQQVPVCWNGAPTERYRPLRGEALLAARRALLTTLGLEAPRVLVAFVAMNPRLKGEARLGRVAKALPESYQVLYIGAPPKRRLGPRERALGPRDDLQKLLPICDVLALPTHYDPCSLVTLEAMSAGVPVITSPENGAAELLQDGEGLWIVDDDAALLEALESLTHDPEGRLRRAAHARESAARWRRADAAGRLLELISAPFR